MHNEYFFLYEKKQWFVLKIFRFFVLINIFRQENSEYVVVTNLASIYELFYEKIICLLRIFIKLGMFY